MSELINFKIVLVRKGTETTVIVRPKANIQREMGNKNYVDFMLSNIGLEKVPLAELIPVLKQIKLNDELIGQCCSICQDEYKPNEYKRSLSCKHTYHKKCVDKWLKTN